MGKTNVTLAEYLAWRDLTGGGMQTSQVCYTLHHMTEECVKNTLVLEGTIPVTEEHRQKVKNKFYSSTVLAALDSINFIKLVQETQTEEEMAESVERVTVDGDKALLSLRPPVFQVAAIETLANGQHVVYVEGRV